MGRAEYMRNYRARKRVTEEPDVTPPEPLDPQRSAAMSEAIARLSQQQRDNILSRMNHPKP